jgi:hypothetical protein
LPKEIIMPKRLERIERSLERVRPHGVHDHVDALAAGQVLHLGDPILVAVVDAGIRPVVEGKLAFVVRARGADQADALRRAHWQAIRPTPPAGAWKQDGIARSAIGVVRRNR